MGVDVNPTIGLEPYNIENWIKAYKVLEILGFADLVDHILLLLWIDK